MNACWTLSTIPPPWSRCPRFTGPTGRASTSCLSAREPASAGAAFVVDGTQSVGALPFDVREIQPDALICAGYKWLLGPYAIGAAYFGPRYDGGEPLEENWISRRGSEDFQRLVDYKISIADGAVRYDAGERGNFILLPMFVESLRRLLEWTPCAFKVTASA